MLERVRSRAHEFAYREAALLACDRGDKQRSLELEEKADALRARFEETYWCEELGTYAIALGLAVNLLAREGRADVEVVL